MSSQSMSVIDNVRFVIEVSTRRAWEVILKLQPAPPQHSTYCNEKKLAAVIYSLAAEFEYRIAVLGADWRVKVDPYHQNLEIQTRGEEDAAYVAELVTSTFADLGIDAVVYKDL